MKQITLGTTGIAVPQNAFGALPIQRVSADEAGKRRHILSGENGLLKGV